jgi:predicted MFS family arabinose efflux permease
MPLMLKTYDYDLTLAGGFMSVYAVVGLATSAFLGIWLKKFGIRNYSLTAGLLLIVGSLITISWPDNSATVLISRAIEGFGFAILAIIGPIIAIRSATIVQRPLAIAIFASWIPIGQLTALGIAQPAIELGQWRIIWWVGIVLTLIVVTCLWLKNREENKNKIQFSTAEDVLNISMRARVSMIIASAIFTLWSAQYLAMSTWLPHYLVTQRGLTPTDAIAPYAIPTVIIIIFNIVGGIILRRGVPVFPILAFVLIIQAGLWLIFDSLSSTASGIAALVIYGAAAGITPTCLFSMPNTILGQHGSNGPAFGVLMTGRHLGVLAGPILLPQLILINGKWESASLFFCIVTLLASALTLALAVMFVRLKD